MPENKSFTIFLTEPERQENLGLVELSTPYKVSILLIFPFTLLSCSLRFSKTPSLS